jgi:ParB family transcriptional regulator, chromosome partitioning protein
MDPNLENADAPTPRARLGRGLAALLGTSPDSNASSTPREGLRRVPLELLQPNPKNPRNHFDESELEGLAESIRERGVLQPVLVRAVPNGPNAYEIIAGERRWRAAQRAAQSDIPVLVLEVEEKEALELSIIENVQRADLNVLEEAAGYAQLASEYGYSHADIAGVVGKRAGAMSPTRFA